MKQNKCNLLLYVHVFVPVRVCTCIWVHMWIYVCMCASMCVSVFLSSFTDMWLLSTLLFGQGLSQNMQFPNLAILAGRKASTCPHLPESLWSDVYGHVANLNSIPNDYAACIYLESHFSCSVTIWNLTTFTLLGQLQNSLFWSRSSFLSIFRL